MHRENIRRLFAGAESRLGSKLGASQSESTTGFKARAGFKAKVGSKEI
jgi:hypothetical protein